MLACALLADIVASQWNLARNVRGLELRSPGGFCCLAVQAVLCYFASAELLGALGLLHQGSLVLRPRVRVYGLLQVHGHHKSYGSGFIKVAMMGFWCFLGLFIFLFEILSENRFQIVFFPLWRRDPVLSPQFPFSPRVVLWWFAMQHLQIAVGGSIKVPWVCSSIAFCNRTGVSKSYWSGCIKVAKMSFGRFVFFLALIIVHLLF
jgi:hypothetical protein